MTQSTSQLGHVAIIMDGNGRWAQARGWPRTVGHRAGGVALRRVIAHAAERHVPELTLYAFSSDNWRRPAPEVTGLMSLFDRTLTRETARLAAEGIRLLVVGRRDRLPRSLRARITAAEQRTESGTRMVVRLAVDYSARAAALQAARAVSDTADEPAFRSAMAAALHSPTPIPDVDLVIRTGGEQRLSDFLLLESAYAELYFTTTLWPDFDAGELDAALDAFAARNRRFGALTRAAG